MDVPRRIDDETAARVPDAGRLEPGARRTGATELAGQSGGVRRIGTGAAFALGAAAALAGTALLVNRQARRAEHRHPPIGDFVEVDGVRLHYLEAGEGPPVVLLHGNASLLDDVRLGIFDELAERHRVIAFDRPGFGYSERPRRTVWTPEAQADLLQDALRALDVQRPVLYGHSWGAPLVITYALYYPQEIRGVVAASGYYYPHRRLDSLLAHLLVAPGIGPLLRNTITPVTGALVGNSGVRVLFDPAPVPETYARFPASLTLRPSHIRASAEDGSTLRAWAERTSPYYRNIQVPVIIVAGDGDRAVDYRKHSVRLHRDLPGSSLRIWPRTGHMVHHTRPAEVIDAIEEVFRMAEERDAATAA
jgi:pimeloyl-ACP methyl ester carboxylesterase